MTDTTQQAAPGVNWETVKPTFKDRLREPVKPPRPSDGAIAMAQRSYDGYKPDPENDFTQHAMSHRFKNEAEAAAAADELKRAGAYTTPESTVSAVIDEGDKRVVTWRAGKKRGRK
jgi:hypothetical protein